MGTMNYYYRSPKLLARTRISNGSNLLGLIFICVIALKALVSVHASSSVSSTILKMHKLYSNSPPHETSLYDILGVNSNATMAEITKAYRRKSRIFHPDKQRASRDSNSPESYESKLKKVREAYEVLKEDSTRLPYHKFGLIDTSLAAMLLTGGKTDNSESSGVKSSLLNQNPYDDITLEQKQLLQWMGYSPRVHDHDSRVQFITSNLVETIRPLVEDTVSQDHLAHQIAMQCDILKTLPLGSQILRCIGRAYRHSGQAYLNKYSISKNDIRFPQNRNLYKQPKMKLRKDLKSISSVLGIGKTWRKSKDLMEAAVATGKLVYIETKEKRRRETQRKREEKSSEQNMIDYNVMDEFDLEMGLFSDTEDGVSSSSDDEILESERSKAQSALIHTLQIEALWKISKIELDQSIQKACKLLLSRDNFFFPSHFAGARIMGGASNQKGEREISADGWVGASGQILDAKVGKLRAAAALVLIGDILVQCSKEGTSWKD